MSDSITSVSGLKDKDTEYYYEVTRKVITTRVTNGPVEGRNKYIKIFLNLANGYTNFDRFRNRAMYVLNKRETWSETKLENNMPHRSASIVKGRQADRFPACCGIRPYVHEQG